jgi:hypothetical protein
MRPTHSDTPGIARAGSGPSGPPARGLFHFVAAFVRALAWLWAKWRGGTRDVARDRPPDTLTEGQLAEGQLLVRTKGMVALFAEPVGSGWAAHERKPPALHVLLVK